MTKAMEQLNLWQLNLEAKQKIFLSDATSSQYLADDLRRKVGMNTNNSKWFNSAPGLAQLTGGSLLGTADFLMSVNRYFNYTEKGNKFDAGVDVVRHGFGILGKIPRNWHALLTSVVASIPSLTESYYTDAGAPIKQLGKKFP
ncbi:hypothetical protein ACJJIQ_01505 [Microbulbifer sp. ANSA003]|uniref:hypothetical protein n=1 Tax=Microbulbifer sp. ANSA003 TaxID=3243360 RepID=UPI0040418C96